MHTPKDIIIIRSIYQEIKRVDSVTRIYMVNCFVYKTRLV